MIAQPALPQRDEQLAGLEKRRKLTKSVTWLRTHRSTLFSGGAVVLAAALSSIWLNPQDWGSLGQWAGAFGTVLAVTVALRISQREVDEQAERRRADKAEYELEQARLVVAVLEYPTPEEDYRADRDFGASGGPTVCITNFSAAHVFNPRIEGFMHQNGGTVNWDIEADPPFGGYEKPPTVMQVNGEDRIPVKLTYDPPLVNEFHYTKVIIGYTDTNGRRWRRIDQGTPERVRSGDEFTVGGPEWYRVER